MNESDDATQSPAHEELSAGHQALSTKKKYTFPKEEHLCRKKLIDELFGKGSSSFGVYPIRLVFTLHEAPTAVPPLVLISVSKRTFKRAVDRNRLKRLLREAYRLHKHLLTERAGGHGVATLGILYTGKEKSELPLLEKKLISGLLRLPGGPAVQPLG